jgi:hypothetical protein
MYRIETYPSPKPIRQDITSFFYPAIFEKEREVELQESVITKEQRDTEEQKEIVSHQEEIDIDQHLRSRRHK